MVSGGNVRIIDFDPEFYCEIIHKILVISGTNTNSVSVTSFTIKIDKKDDFPKLGVVFILRLSCAG